AGDLLDVAVRKRGDPDWRGLSSAVALPGEEGARQRDVGDLGTIRREARLPTHWERQLFLEPALQRGEVELPKPRVAVARRGEEHLLAVGRPAERNVGVGVPRQPFRDSAFRRHDEDVRVAVVLAR